MPSSSEHSPLRTAVVDVSVEVDESSSVANNSVLHARLDSFAYVAPAAVSSCTSTHSAPITAPVIPSAPHTQSSHPSPIPSHCPPTSPPIVAAEVCNEVIDSTSVATKSILPARPEPTAPSARANDNNSNNTLTHNTTHTSHTTCTARTTHTTHTTSTTRPHTRTTSDTIHPFFTDLLYRTGKTAKHFRRLYVPTATIRECGLLPIYSQQKSSKAPVTVLPASFQHLCLAYFELLNDNYLDSRMWPCMPRIPNNNPVFWNDSMLATYNACYLGRYTDKYMDDTLHAAPDCRYSDAFRWLKTEAMEYHKHNKTGMAADKTEKKSGSEDSSKES